MDQTPGREQRALWSFWIAAGLAAVAAVAPFLFGGGSSRITAGLVPFALAAVAFGACALVHHQGRPITTVLYFLASLAVVYGILSMLALPLRLAVLGTCPRPGACELGLERPMTSAETSVLDFSIGMGIIAILTGFFGLRVLYQRDRARRQSETSTSPPARGIPPVTTKSEAETETAPAPAPTAKPVEAGAAVAEAPAPPEPKPEPPEPAAELDELPAHEPDLELPAHMSEVTPEPRHAEAMPARQRQPKRGEPKAPPAPPTSTDTE